MRAPAHMAFGLVFTGSVAALSDINILSDVTIIGFVLIGSLLPDIDHPKSLLGRPLYFISNYLFTTYGHRTFTHSTLFVLIVFTLFRSLSVLFGIDGDLSYLVTLSVVSHLMLDMFTIQGVQLFYPFIKNNCVVPGNPSYRLSTNNKSHEVLVICVCVMMTYFMKDLMTNGFWTTYNQKFASIEHLKTEFKRTDQTLYVSLSHKVMNRKVDVSGYLVDLSTSDLILADSLGVSAIPLNSYFQDIAFFPTDKEYEINRYDVDSTLLSSIDLSSLVEVHLLAKDNISGLHSKGTFDSRGVNLTYPQDLSFVSLPSQIYGYVYALEFN